MAPHPNGLSEQDVEGGVMAEWQLQPDGVCDEQTVQDAEDPLGASRRTADVLLHLQWKEACFSYFISMTPKLNDMCLATDTYLKMPEAPWREDLC